MSTLGAYELDLVFEIPFVSPQLKIWTLEMTGNNLFIGTNEGSLMRYEIGDYRGISHTKLSSSRDLGPTSPVTFLRSASALDRLLVLCDASLYVVNASDLSPLALSGSPKFKSVSACCVNENPNTDDPFSVQVCLAKKKQLAVINITEERISVEKIREMSGLIQSVCMDGHFVCAALNTHYVVLNIATGHTQDLFPVDPDSIPVMIRIAKEEFLLSAPGGLGMFVTSAGVSERPPIQWTKPVLKFIYCHPYIIAITESNDSIVVYSVLDQKPKQTLQFFDGTSIGNFDGQLLVASTNSVYKLKPVSVQVQIEYLLEKERFEEALELAENAVAQNSTDLELELALARARLRSAFISLKKFELQRARELLVLGRADPNEVISLFPRLLPSSSNFTRSVPALHDIADINQLTRHDEDKQEALEEFLVDYLEHLHVTEIESFPRKKDIDTALIKLYAKNHPTKLTTFLKNDDFLCDIDDCFNVLEKSGRYHGMGLLHQRQGHYNEALSIWSKLLNGDRVDETFPGIDFFIGSLMRAPIDSIWRYADFVLSKDEQRGVEIFMRRNEELALDREERIVNFLQQYRSAYLIYLEYLVNERKSEVEFHHSELAVTYLDFIQSTNDEEKKTELRRKFQNFTIASSLVRPKYLLSRLEGMSDEDLLQEKAAIYGKLGDHEKAIDIYVHKMKNIKGAEIYCDQISGQNVRLRQRLLKNLLHVFLDKNLKDSDRDSLMMAALDLVTRRAQDMSGPDVIESLPEFWSLAALNPAVTKLLRSTLHNRRTCNLTRALSKSENINVKLNHLRLSRTPVFLQETSYCVLCHKAFTSCEVARYPNGVVIHIECMKDANICPITGQIFSIPKSSNASN